MNCGNYTLNNKFVNSQNVTHVQPISNTHYLGLAIRSESNKMWKIYAKTEHK